MDQGAHKLPPVIFHMIPPDGRDMEDLGHPD